MLLLRAMYRFAWQPAEVKHQGSVGVPITRCTSYLGSQVSYVIPTNSLETLLVSTPGHFVFLVAGITCNSDPVVDVGHCALDLGVPLRAPVRGMGRCCCCPV